MKKGNIAMSTDNAMWLAIAQASSLLKWSNASVTIRYSRRMKSPLACAGDLAGTWRDDARIRGRSANLSTGAPPPGLDMVR